VACGIGGGVDGGNPGFAGQPDFGGGNDPGPIRFGITPVWSADGAVGGLYFCRFGIFRDELGDILHPTRPSTLFGLLFALAASEYLENPRVVPAIGAGAALSAVASTRHYDAVLLAIPAVVALVRRSSLAHWRLVPLVAISGLPVIGALLAYYWATGTRC